MDFQKWADVAAALNNYTPSIRYTKAEWKMGVISDNDFIGLLNLYFDLAWGDVHGYGDDEE